MSDRRETRFRMYLASGVILDVDATLRTSSTRLKTSRMRSGASSARSTVSRGVRRTTDTCEPLAPAVGAPAVAVRDN
jgi:hypothetical protein